MKTERVVDQYWMFWTPEPNTGCYLWLGSLGGRSMRRPKFNYGGRRRYVVDVFARDVHGECPPGKERSHKCHVHECVNPDHVVYESHAENMARGWI